MWHEIDVLDNWQLVVLPQSGGTEFDPRSKLNRQIYVYIHIFCLDGNMWAIFKISTLWRLLTTKSCANLDKHEACQLHDDVIKWKHYPRYWPFVQGNHRSRVQRPVTRSFDVFFDLCLNKRFSKQSWGWWFETQSRSLWHHCIAGGLHWDYSTDIIWYYSSHCNWF